MIGLFYYGQKISPQPTSDESKSPISISINPVLIVSVLLPVIASYGLKQVSYNNADKSITCDSTAIPEHFIQPTLHNIEATCLTVNNNSDYLIEYFFSPEKLISSAPVRTLGLGKTTGAPAQDCARESITGPPGYPIGENDIYYLEGTIMKYLHRWKYKNKPKYDLEKARWYLDRLISKL